MSDRREAGWLLLWVVSAVFLTSTTELLHDEAYYWTWSQRLAWGYFDHPPAVAWAIAASARWLGGEWGVRLGPGLALFAGAWLASRTLVPTERRWAFWAGWLSFPLLALLPSVAAPDTLLIASAPLFCWAYARYLEEDGLWRALVVALAAALMLYAKLHGGLLVLGAVLGAPEVLRRPSLWAAAGAGALLLLPQALWQWQHEATAFGYHLFEAHGGGFEWQEPLEYALLQVILPGLLLGPWLWWRGWKGWRATPFDRALGGMVLACVGAFLLFSFGKKIEGNWTVAGHFALGLLVLRTAPEIPTERGWFRGLGLASIAAVLLLKGIFAVPAAGAWIPKVAEVHGWRAWAEALDRDTADCHLVANRYQWAAKLSFYLQRPVPALNVNARSNQWDLWGPDAELRGKRLCWLTRRDYGLSSEAVAIPSGRTLRLVRGVTIEELRDLEREQRRR